METLWPGPSSELRWVSSNGPFSKSNGISGLALQKVDFSTKLTSFQLV